MNTKTARHSLDMLHGSLIKKILLFALPIAASSILQQLFNSADVAVVGRFAGDTALAAVGSVCALRKKGGAALLMIPVTVLGGALYHLIFEAKAQYAYPYMVYMLPLAAAGLCRLEDGAARLICSGKKWVQRRAECARTSHRD